MIFAPVKEGFEVTQNFGENRDYYFKKFKMEGHNGQDIATPQGTDIFAPIDGVAWLWNDPNGYGKCTFLTGMSEGKDGWRRQIVLAHFSAHMHEQNSFVKQGDKLALSGNSGNSSGPHLHWGYRKVRVMLNGKPYHGMDFNDVKGISFQIEDADNGFFGYQDIFNKGWIASHNISEY